MKFIIFLSLLILSITQKIPQKDDLLKKTRLLSCLSLTQLRLQQDKANIDKLIASIMRTRKEINDKKKALELINNIMLVNCFDKITDIQTQKIMLSVQKGKINTLDPEFDQILHVQSDFLNNINHFASKIQEIQKMLVEIKKEEKEFAEKLKDKNYKPGKEFEEMYKKFNRTVGNNKNKKEKKKKDSKKINKKQIYKDTKWEKVFYDNENNIKINLFNLKKTYETFGLNTFFGIIIATLIFLNIVNCSNKIKNELNQIQNEKLNEINNENEEIENEEEQKEDLNEEVKEDLKENIKEDIKQDIKN